jgi:uncharacterized membrane protein YhdT
MIAVVIFALHFLAAGYAFIVWKKKGGRGEGILAVAFMALIFSVGWSIAAFFTQLVLPPEGLTTWLDADSLSLVLLTIGETVFYFVLLKKGIDRRAEGKGEPPTSV